MIEKRTLIHGIYYKVDNGSIQTEMYEVEFFSPKSGHVLIRELKCEREQSQVLEP